MIWSQSSHKPSIVNVQLQRLKSYANIDLQSLSVSEQHQFNSLANSVLPNGADTIGTKGVPWFLWTHPSGSLVLLEASHIRSIPGQSSARITVITGNGKLLTQTRFLTGHRIDVVNAHRLASKSRNEFLFVINSQPVINGRDVAKQFYTIIDDYPFLLRLEDSDGNPVENGNRNHLIGPELPKQYDKALFDKLRSMLADRFKNAR